MRLRLSPRLGLILWVVFHLVLALTPLLRSDLGFDTSFFSILPAASENPALAESERRISQRLNSRLRLLIGHENPVVAREVGDRLAEFLRSGNRTDTVDWSTDGVDAFAVRDALGDYRYRLLSWEDQDLLIAGEADVLAQDALSSVYSPFSMVPLDRLDEDPFLLDERILRGLLEDSSSLGGSMDFRDGVMTAEFENRTYLQLNAAFPSDRDSSEAVLALRDLTQNLVKADSELDILFSGFPVHNAETSSRASREIGIITTVALAILTLILLLVFRSPLPWLASVGMLVVASGSALAVSLALFGRIHLFALVFGTSLIGVGIDYALHFFVARNRVGGDGSAAVKATIVPLALGMITTVLSYLGLSLTPIPLLSQVAVFSIVGILSAFFSAMLIFPLLPGNALASRALEASRGLLRSSEILRGLPPRIILPIGVALAGLVAGGTLLLDMDNDIRRFYQPSQNLLDSEARVNLIAGGETSSRYFIVFGDSPEDLLENEGQLAEKLRVLEERRQLDSWLGITRFLPPPSSQDSSLNLARNSLAPLAQAQFAALGFDDQESRGMASHFLPENAPYLYPDDLFGVQGLESLEDLWLGDVGGLWASLVIPSGYDDSGLLESLANVNVYWNDSVRDISGEFQDNSRLALLLVGLAYGVIFLVLCFLRGPYKAVNMILLPLIAGTMTTGIIGWTGLRFNLFSVFGLVLALGIGIDYAIFMVEGHHDRQGTFLAVGLSCLSTVLSFGALALSGFPPVADFGRTVFLGVTLSFLLAPILSSKVSS